MTKVYDDSELNIKKGPFDRPLKSLSIEIDCKRYDPNYAPIDSLNINFDNINQDDIF
jgi:hypothetical protein